MSSFKKLLFLVRHLISQAWAETPFIIKGAWCVMGGFAVILLIVLFSLFFIIPWVMIILTVMVSFFGSAKLLLSYLNDPSQYLKFMRDIDTDYEKLNDELLAKREFTVDE
jgi:hypothetical protein